MTSDRETARFWLAHMRRQLTALAENPQQRTERDDADLDQQDDRLGVIHDQDLP